MKNNNQFSKFFNAPMKEMESMKESRVRERSAEYLNLKSAVSKFSGVMLEKLAIKANQGFRGWDKPEYTDKQIIKQITEHFKRLKKGEPQAIDIANLCMFLWNKTKHKYK